MVLTDEVFALQDLMFAMISGLWFPNGPRLRFLDLSFARKSQQHIHSMKIQLHIK